MDQTGAAVSRSDLSLEQSAAFKTINHLASAGWIRADPITEPTLVDTWAITYGGKNGIFDRAEVFRVEHLGIGAKTNLVEAPGQVSGNAVGWQNTGKPRRPCRAAILRTWLRAATCHYLGYHQNSYHQNTHYNASLSTPGLATV